MNLVLRRGQASQAARAAFGQMTAAEWKDLCDFAAEVVALQEMVATGQVFLVAPVSMDRLQVAVAAGAAPTPAGESLQEAVKRLRSAQAAELVGPGSD